MHAELFKNATPPPASRTEKSGLLERIREMSVGDMLRVTNYRKAVSVRASVCKVASIMGDGRKYTTRSMGNCVQIWRIA